MANIGYDDTPILPGSKWRVHGGKRPQPKVVTSGDKPGDAPSDAVVLFDGKDASKWVGRDGAAAQWTVKDGIMEVNPKAGDIQSKEHFGDCQIHVEWMAPSVIKGESQGRGNSGVFLMGKFEIQVLDCYNNLTYPDGTTGGIYGQYPPLVNACRKPGEWQVYDMFFEVPRFDGKKLVSPAYVTVVYNGILIHHRQAIMGPTGHKTLSSYDNPLPAEGPLRLQAHGDLVCYRNIWVRPLKGYDAE